VHHLVFIPVLLPLGCAILMLLAWKSVPIQRALSLIATGALLVVSFMLLGEVADGDVLAIQAGNWRAPFGITFVCDILSALMVAVTGLVGFCGGIYGLFSIDRERERHGYHPLMLMLLAAVNGAFLTGDFFNLYVWFEVMLMASFVLMSVGGGQRQTGGAIKYVLLNLVSSTLFLTALGIIYAKAGTLNMADLAVKLSQSGDARFMMSSTMLLLIAFGIKAAVFPLFFWLPASYHNAPVVVSAVFAGLLTKVGVYALIRTFTLVIPFAEPGMQTLLLFVSGMTMLTGVLGAACQTNIRRILSFHIVSQIGYMTFGLAIFTPLGILAAIFYVIHHIVVKANLFFVAGIVERISGSSSVKEQGGLYRRYPLLGFLFLIPAMSLAGLPPLSGFFAKFLIIKSALEIGAVLTTVVALLVGLLTMFSMTKIWAESFWKDSPKELPALKEPAHRMLMVPVGIMAAITIFFGLNSGWLYNLAGRSAEQLLDRTAYIEEVMRSQEASIERTAYIEEVMKAQGT